MHVKMKKRKRDDLKNKGGVWVNIFIGNSEVSKSIFLEKTCGYNLILSHWFPFCTH